MGVGGGRRPSKCPRVWTSMGVAVVMMMMMAQVKPGNSDINKDKEECANQLAGLATCLPYVGGESKAPTPDCCTGLKQVVKDSKKCLCILVKDRNDPSLGLKINATLALSLPTTCQAPANVSECPAILHLAPNDPDVKIFNGFAQAPAAANTTTPSTGGATPSSGGKSIAAEKSDGGNGNIDLIMSRTLYGLALLSSFVASHRFIFY